ncbi:transcriptional regulator [Afipia sp. P52-10]|uniref:helix-turn-helix domain-containing protein n=1 Tax=Afipia sp. P52-10 TaxID=1429916 RepID=UPI0003DF0607|nr:helix-turn-helix transcriptional regulator [Afipia sp. P52-10]ETR75053.1 transcriptional regulator [Afipia sp. P52-10]
MTARRSQSTVCKCANAVDHHVAARIRQARQQRHVTLAQLADLLGITIQQVQKYEKVTNRISAGRLAAIADALGLPIAWFFADKPPLPTALEAAR